MGYDAFSKCHPLVNFLFFIGAIGCGVVIQHPLFVAAGCICAAVYYLLLSGRAGWKLIAGMLPVGIFIAIVNPLFNTDGQTVLFQLFGKPYTLEALLYGVAIAGVFLLMMLWFGCYNKVLTSDKFISLFGSVIPALSLLLVMVLRMIPNLQRKARQILGARKSIGKGAGESSSKKEKLMDGMSSLSALTDWALEGSIVTADSMRARGYGAAKRSSFHLYTMKTLDWTLIVVTALLAGFVLFEMLSGGTAAEFTPRIVIAPINGHHILGLAAYCLYLLIPTILHIKEAIQWHISKSRI